MSVREAILHHITSRRNPRSLSSRLRKKRLAPLLEMVDAYHDAYGFVKIIDVGGTRRYWQVIDPEFFARRRVHITLANIELDPEDVDADGMFSAVTCDGCDLSIFDSGAFHIGHANSAVEHVQGRDRMKRFAAELQRVAQSLFVQTPNRGFPVEPHFMVPCFQWMPQTVRVFLRRKFNLGYYPPAKTREDARMSVDSIDLLDIRQFGELFPDCELKREKLLLLTKSLVAIRRAGPASRHSTKA